MRPGKPSSSPLDFMEAIGRELCAIAACFLMSSPAWSLELSGLVELPAAATRGSDTVASAPAKNRLRVSLFHTGTSTSSVSRPQADLGICTKDEDRPIRCLILSRPGEPCQAGQSCRENGRTKVRRGAESTNRDLRWMP